MKQFLILLLMIGILHVRSSAQVSINTDNSVPDNSAMLDVKSTTTGLLPPRMTSTQMNAIVSPAEGLTIYNTTIKSLCWFDGISWTYVPQNGKSCGSVTYEGKTYETVVIGLQCWMKQNLNVGIRIDGSQEQTNNSVIEKYCYDNNEANCDVYGGLYQWDEMMNYTASSNSNPSNRQGICPSGWHIPSDVEWCQMTTYLDASVICTNTQYLGTDIGGKMKEAGTIHWPDPNIGATNSSGFTALPGGQRNPDYTYSSFPMYVVYWSSTENLSTTAWFVFLYHFKSQLGRNNSEKQYGLSLRCVKD